MHILIIANMQCPFLSILSGHLSEPPPEILAQIRERKRKESELEKQKVYIIVILHSSVIKILNKEF